MSEVINNIRRFVNQKTGYDIVRFAGQHNLRSHLSRVFDIYKIDTIIDVGANEGQFGQFLRSLGYSGWIYSFEPVAAPFEKLSQTSASDSKWIVHNCALGATPSEALINVTKHTSFSSILSPSDYALGHWENSHVDHQEKIVIRTLDECCADGMVSGSDTVFLKMDTQGYDLEVFKGAQSTLHQVRGILSELSLIAVYDGCPNYMQSLSVFEAAGFSVSGFYPITRNKNLSLNEVDCVLVNTEKLDQVST